METATVPVMGENCSPGHYFCKNCIVQWLRQKNECPVCREVFLPPHSHPADTQSHRPQLVQARFPVSQPVYQQDVGPDRTIVVVETPTAQSSTNPAEFVRLFSRLNVFPLTNATIQLWRENM